ncbi:MAG TPA: pyridoxal phosphate-dependent aminotransferase [Candidatus Polarisedimenticolaceae bacterium]|nr:pyridoxal phosphate-dependent aminotransferase [Candidatus Polarisedimenticolaceae bacterium]
MFSSRLPGDLSPNALARLRASSAEVPYDLTASDPTRSGVAYPAGLLAPLADPRGLRYRPDPLGLVEARQAVARIYTARGLAVDPERVVLTASSSEAYSLLFKVLGDPGDAVLLPQPSYPLFAHLAALDGLQARPYRLVPEDGWQPDCTEPFDPRARLLLVVHPNNPTGTFVAPEVLAALDRRCAAADVALVVDEVFLDYPLDGTPRRSALAGSHDALTFVLGGLSKSCGLPQLKLSWVVLAGPTDRVERAVERLEFAADQYLSVATPVQLALPRLLTAGAEVRHALAERCHANLATLRERVARRSIVSLVVPEGGWSAVLRLPASVDEERFACDLLEHHGVAVHPGAPFGFPRPGYFVLSLLPRPEIFAAGIERLLTAAAGALADPGCN